LEPLLLPFSDENNAIRHLVGIVLFSEPDADRSTSG
jgi:hypothetical protein